MKGFKKLALVTAVAALPMAGFAMEAMDDAALSGVTGQDGLVVTIDTPSLNMDIIIHDTDGLAAISGNAGAIVIRGMTLATGAGGIGIVVDADGNSLANAPVLNIAVSIPTGTTINTGAIRVATSAGIGNALTNETADILSSMSITLGATDLNIQLGNEVQTVGALVGTQMIALDTSIVGGITIDNFSLNDASVGGGSIAATQIRVNGNGGPLNVVAGVNLTTAGMVIGLDQLGTATGINVQMDRVSLGSANAIGDIEIIGLNLNGTTITVAGKP